MEPTEEQQRVISYTGNRLIVKARAGTGKTYTLVRFSKARPTQTILYLAYNRALRDEAVRKFPRNGNVLCLTSHQLAYKSLGVLYKHKIADRASLTLIHETLASKSWGLTRDAYSTVMAFMASDHDEITEKNFEKYANEPNKTTLLQTYINQVIEGAKTLWAVMCDVNHPFPCLPDCYLKLYQLSKPDLSRFDWILFDESQDANPPTRAIVACQRSGLILVGDEHQQIYRFRGAVNAMDAPEFKDADVLYLTNSFRFGPRVAMVANAILEFKGETMPVHGHGADGNDFVHGFATDELTQQHTAYISRTLMAVIEKSIDLVTQGKRVYWVGGIDAYNIETLLHLHFLKTEQVHRIKDKKLLAQFKTWDDYVVMAEESGDSEMLRCIKILGAYLEFESLEKHLRASSVEQEFESHATVTTAHRSKGLEWETVVMNEDFPDVLDPMMKKEAQEDELNLLYVVATRAMKHLVINTSVFFLINHVAKLRAQARDLGQMPASI